MKGDEVGPVPPQMIRAGGDTLRGTAGPLAYAPAQCEAIDVDGVQSCRVGATWRVVADQCRPGGEGIEWLICQPHLGVAVMLADECYGSPIEVHRHGVG